MGMYTKAVLCWGIKIDPDRVSEDILEGYGLDECPLLWESEFAIENMGNCFSGDITPILIGSKSQHAKGCSSIPLPVEPDEATKEKMVDLIKTLYGVDQLSPEEKSFQLYLGTLTY